MREQGSCSPVRAADRPQRASNKLRKQSAGRGIVVRTARTSGYGHGEGWDVARNEQRKKNNETTMNQRALGSRRDAGEGIKLGLLWWRWAIHTHRTGEKKEEMVAAFHNSAGDGSARRTKVLGWAARVPGARLRRLAESGCWMGAWLRVGEPAAPQRMELATGTYTVKRTADRRCKSLPRTRGANVNERSTARMSARGGSTKNGPGKEHRNLEASWAHSSHWRVTPLSGLHWVPGNFASKNVAPP